MIIRLLLLSFCMSAIFSLPENIIATSNAPHNVLIKRIQDWISSLDSNVKSYENLKKIGKTSLPYLYKALNENFSIKTKKHIVQLISEWKTINSEKILLEYIHNKKVDKKIVEKIFIALEKIGTEKSLLPLSKFTSASEASISYAAVTTICKIKTIKKVPYLIDLLQHWNNQILKMSHKALQEITKQKLSAEYSVWKKWWENYSHENNN